MKNLRYSESSVRRSNNHITEFQMKIIGENGEATIFKDITTRLFKTVERHKL